MTDQTPTPNDPRCDICHKQCNGDYVYHNGGRVIGTLIVCGPCDRKDGGK